MKTNRIIIAVAALIFGLVAVPILAVAADPVGINSPPMALGQPIYYDANFDGVNDPGELMGYYDVYNALLGFDFHWEPVPGADYYRVSLLQYPPPNTGPGAPVHEVKVGYHSTADPRPTQFFMDSFGVDEWFCLDCVTIVKVVPVTLIIEENTDGNTTRHYTPLAEGTQFSAPFVFEIPRGGFNGRSGSGVICGDESCGKGEAVTGGLHYCPTDCN